MADIQSNPAQSDAYLSAMIQDVRSVSSETASLATGRRGFFKLAGAAGLLLGFTIGHQASAAETADSGDQVMNAFIRITPDKEASVVLAGSGLIGIAFAPGGTAILTTSNAVYHCDLGVEGFEFA